MSQHYVKPGIYTLGPCGITSRSARLISRVLDENEFDPSKLNFKMFDMSKRVHRGWISPEGEYHEFKDPNDTHMNWLNKYATSGQPNEFVVDTKGIPHKYKGYLGYGARTKR